MSGTNPPLGQVRLNMAAHGAAPVGGSGLEVWDGTRWIAVVGLRLGEIRASDDLYHRSSLGWPGPGPARRRVTFDAEVLGEVGQWAPVDNRLLSVPTAHSAVRLTAVMPRVLTVCYWGGLWHVRRGNRMLSPSFSSYRECCSWAQQEALRNNEVVKNDNLRVATLRLNAAFQAEVNERGEPPVYFTSISSATEWARKEGVILMDGASANVLSVPLSLTSFVTPPPEEPSPSGRVLDL